MADEQTPQSDLIDDAIRNAERQLEEKLEALRMSALGEHTSPDPEPDSDVAVLRPTGAARASNEPADDAPSPALVSVDASFDEPDTDTPAPSAWRETEGDDVTFAPLDETPLMSGSELYVPELDDETDTEADAGEMLPPVPVDELPLDEPTTPAPPASTTIPTRSVSALSASWDDVDDEEDEQVAPESSWSPPATKRGPSRPAMPSEDELQFWAQTRTALRNLQQVTDAIPEQVSGEVSTEVARIVQDEIAPSAATLRLLHQQLQQSLPKLADRIEGSIDQALTMPANGLRQVRDELPIQADRVVREAREAMREELAMSGEDVHGAVRQDLAKLEQSIATNVTRMAQGTGESVTRVERDVDLLGESLVRFERGVHSEFDRVEAQLRAAIERAGQSMRDELVEPSETVRKLDDELPARFGRVERTVIDQVQQTQRDLSTVLVTLVETTQVAVDRLGTLSTSVETDRVQRAEDVELMVDTVTTGWESLAGAVKALFEQNEENARRIAGIEQRLGQLRDLEGSVEDSMRELRSQVASFEQTPVVVTVSHPDAQVQDTQPPRRS